MVVYYNLYISPLPTTFLWVLEMYLNGIIMPLFISITQKTMDSSIISIVFYYFYMSCSSHLTLKGVEVHLNSIQSVIIPDGDRENYGFNIKEPWAVAKKALR